MFEVRNTPEMPLPTYVTFVCVRASVMNRYQRAFKVMLFANTSAFSGGSDRCKKSKSACLPCVISLLAFVCRGPSGNVTQSSFTLFVEKVYRGADCVRDLTVHCVVSTLGMNRKW